MEQTEESRAWTLGDRGGEKGKDIYCRTKCTLICTCENTSQYLTRVAGGLVYACVNRDGVMHQFKEP